MLWVPGMSPLSIQHSCLVPRPFTQLAYQQLPGLVQLEAHCRHVQTLDRQVETGLVLQVIGPFIPFSTFLFLLLCHPPVHSSWVCTSLQFLHSPSPAPLPGSESYQMQSSGWSSWQWEEGLGGMLLVIVSIFFFDRSASPYFSYHPEPDILTQTTLLASTFPDAISFLLK